MILVRWAILAENNKDLMEAQVSFERALRLSEENEEERDHLKKAAAEADQERKDQKLEIHLQLSWVYFRRNKYSACLVQIIKAEEIKEVDYESLYIKIRCLLAAGRRAEAVEAKEKVDEERIRVPGLRNHFILLFAELSMEIEEGGDKVKLIVDSDLENC